MNPANFPNGGAMPGGANPHGQMQVPPRNENQQLLINHVAQALQAQGPFSGWRAEFPIKDRALKVYQMITSLRLIQPRIDMQNAAQAALSFEQKAFKDAREKSDYEKECTEKLLHIRDTRARQAAAMQGGMGPQGGIAPGMAGVAPNQIQGAFPQHMNRPVQTSPIPGQPQMSMGINDPNQQAALQQQRQQQQQQSQAMLQQQRAQPRPANNAQLTDDLSMLSTQEYDHVCQLASQMLSRTSPEHMEKIKMNLQNMTPEQRQYLARRSMDPITYFFRSQALTHMRRHKRNRMEMARTQNTGLDSNTAAMMGDPMMNPQQRQAFQNMVNLQRNSAFQMNGQPNLDPSSFIGNVENIQGQQVDGLRSQEAGQLVVPASSSQMNQQPFATPQSMFPMGQQLGANGQTNANGPGISPQFLSQHPSNPGVQQDRTQQAQPFPPQSQAQTPAQARAQAAHKAQMGMPSQPGQTNPQAHQQIPQQGGMSMLNRPMASGQMSPAQVAAQVRPPSRPAGMGPHPGGVQPIAGQPGMQVRPQIPPGLPPAAQEQLAQMSPEQLNIFLMNHQRRAMANSQAAARASATPQSMPMNQNRSQPGQGPQMVNGQLGNNQNMRASINLQQQLAGMGPQSQSQMLQGQQPSIQQRQEQQRQQELIKLQLMRHQNSAGIEMTAEQVKEMDRMNFPPSILNSIPNMNAPALKNIKTWGQLKQFAASNPHALGGMDVPKLMSLEKLHFTQMLAQKEAGRTADPNGSGHGLPMHPLQGQPQPFANPQNFQPGQQPFPMGMPPMRSITAQEIQMARQRFGAQAQNYTDEQIREVLFRHKQKQFMQAAQNRAAIAFASQGMNQNPAGQTQQPPAPMQQNPTQVKQQPQPRPAPGQPGPQVQPNKAPVAGKTTKGPTKQPPKRKSNNDEVVEIDPTTQKSAQVPATAAPRPGMQLTREQLAAMTPQQRAQLEAQMRRSQGQPRAPVSRTSADEAWNNLPEKIRQMYNEIARNVPIGNPLPIPPEQKAGMMQQLRECTDMLGRMDTLVQWFAKIPGQEKNVRSLLLMRIQLMRQFKPGPDWALNDQITIAPEYLGGTINYIKKLFHAMITRVNQQQNHAPGQRPNVTQGPSPVANQSNIPPLNASNLQQLQQQEEALLRARRASGQSVPGTSTVPQPPFGAPSPQGVPHAYGPGSFPPEKLKLPPPKKRKQSHAGGAVSPTTPTSKAPGAKADANLDGAVTGPFKCSVPECQHHYQGFATQPALAKHIEENHQAEEPISDPLEFAIESIRSGLVKDEKPGVQDPKKAFAVALEVPQAPNRSGATTSPARPQAKTEGTTPATGTPMGRVPSQLGFKSASPASYQQTTPRTSGKAQMPSAGKPTSGREGKMGAAKPADAVQYPDNTATKDPWADSAISLEAIHDTFMDFGDDGVHGLGLDPMDEFLNSEMFTKIQSKDTPDSIETGVATQTPRDSDTSKDEDFVKIGATSEDNWIPVEWINLPRHFEGGLLMNEGWEDVDWETIDRKEAEMNVDEGGVPVYAM